jgi:AcrR family transcriptional regulator
MSERGFSRTTTSEIAEAAGVSERTFFRHFPTKEDVIFADGAFLLDEIVGAIRRAPVDASPMELVGAALHRLSELFQPRRAYLRSRAVVISSEPSLRERELLKQHEWTVAIAKELTQRSMTVRRASVLAACVTATFRTVYDEWVASRRTLSLIDAVHLALDQLASDLG